METGKILKQLAQVGNNTTTSRQHIVMPLLGAVTNPYIRASPLLMSLLDRVNTTHLHEGIFHRFPNSFVLFKVETD